MFFKVEGGLGLGWEEVVVVVVADQLQNALQEDVFDVFGGEVGGVRHLVNPKQEELFFDRQHFIHMRLAVKLIRFQLKTQILDYEALQETYESLRAENSLKAIRMEQLAEEINSMKTSLSSLHIDRSQE